ncbi:polysaccharide deacetylase [Zhengella mangrovi]|uniref:Polysaccharide deacetylase n=1 Tax=Zhengella mangrovi TaxID=1982044 RepID=A0A2G1QNL7_9HYPH|nr:polysaccharide deacetylase family protein [Zhengella mangrovi]PHP67061.1 polysaccharide deacetylase [Zhengella mangrovi]
MRFSSRLPALLALSLAAVVPALAADRTRPVQEVVISFDGAHDNAQWDRALALGERTGARFTFFLSCTFLLTPETKSHYVAPHHGEAASNVGFGQSADEVRTRLGHILAAWRAGHEIASHGCGHFDGKDWTRADWEQEFDSFADILKNTWRINGFGPAPDGWSEMAAGVIGFRAPYLSTSAALFAAEKARGYAYDASTVGRDPQPAARKHGLWSMPLPMIPEGPKQKRIIAMDYNWFARHSGAKEDPANGAAYEERAYDALMGEFDRAYHGNRKPVQAGFHFTLMNGGAYWRALERFATEVCARPDVACHPIRAHIAQFTGDSPVAGLRY